MKPNHQCTKQRNRSADDSLRAGGELKQELLERLKNLTFLAFEECLCRLFLAMGYESADILGRIHFKGRNRRGGADLQAFGRIGISDTKVLVQVKQYDRPVPAKYVDELRGAILRLNAQTGVIITTATFSPVAVASAKASSLLPIRLIDGEALVRLLIRYRVGVRTGLVLALKLDDLFFAELSRQ